MSLMYFYYISKQKVDMLAPQAKSWWQEHSIEIGPEVNLGFVGLGAKIKGEKKDDLFSNTRSVIEWLDKTRNLKSLSSPPKKNDYFRVNDDWYHGVFSFEKDTINDLPLSAHVVFSAYVLWQVWNDSIILLVGSPSNILGEYEPCVSISPSSVDPVAVDLLRSKVEEDFEGDGSMQSEKIDRQIKIGSAPMLMEVFKRMSGVSLGRICVEHLSGLPRTSVETVFRIFAENRIKPHELPVWTGIVDRFEDGPQKEKLYRCRRVFSGSPIYTALT